MSFVFISHRTIDKPRIREFVLDILGRGVPVWVDNFEEFNIGLTAGDRRIDRSMLMQGIRTGEDYPTEIDKALLSATTIVLFWSKSWTPDREMLRHEHGIALARHRANSGIYLPVFLDKFDDLPNNLLEYRSKMADSVQAFDVATYGPSHWSSLSDAVVSAMKPEQAPPTRQVDSLGVTIPALLGREARISVLKRFPRGPAVDPFTIRNSIKLAFAQGTNAVRAKAIIADANDLLLDSISPRPAPRFMHAIHPASLPDPSVVGLLDYWAAVFDEACMLGPRMVAALILGAPPNLIGQTTPDEPLFRDVIELLEALHNGPAT